MKSVTTTGSVLILAMAVLALLLPLPVQARQINVSSVVPNALADSVAKAVAGDIVNLTDAGPYILNATITNSAFITIQGDTKLAKKALIKGSTAGFPLFTMAASLKLKKLEMDCKVSAGRAIKMGGTKPSIWVQDCDIHDTGDDIIRSDAAAGVVVFDAVFGYNIADSPLDLRGGAVDTLKVLNSTFFKTTTKSRIDVVIAYALFDGVTISNTRDTAINFRQDAPKLIVKNCLITHSKARPFSLQKAVTGSIDYTNVYQDPALVAAGKIDSTWSYAEPKTKELFTKGTGNINENPAYADTTKNDLRVFVATQTATGSDSFTPMGDPRWGTYDKTKVEEIIQAAIPKQHQLYQNYPNPFNAETVLSFEINHSTPVTVEIYNLRGEKVRTLVQGYYSTGYYRLNWDGMNGNGAAVSAGIYLARLRAEGFQQTRKMTVLK